MNKVRTVMIDDVGIRTSLSAIEIASLPKINTELVRENKKLEHNWNELKKWLTQLQKFKGINQQGFSWGVAQEVLDKMTELERGEE